MGLFLYRWCFVLFANAASIFRICVSTPENRDHGIGSTQTIKGSFRVLISLMETSARNNDILGLRMKPIVPAVQKQTHLSFAFSPRLRGSVVQRFCFYFPSTALTFAIPFLASAASRSVGFNSRHLRKYMRASSRRCRATRAWPRRRLATGSPGAILTAAAKLEYAS